jgi:signal transduction histidine kinase
MMGPSLRYRMIAALLFVLGICGLHFVGMTAVTFELDPSIAASGQVMAPSLLAVAIAAVSVLIVALAQASSLVDDQLARRATKEAQLLTLRVEERTAELRKAQEDLLREERLSTLGQVTATMAHELRNPLSAIRNTIYAIGMATAGRDEAVDRLIARLERNVVRCDRIVSDLLDFTRMRKLAYEIEIPDQWLSTLLDNWVLPERITLVRNFGAGSVELRFDVERMRRAITNLLDNATQAMAERENSAHILAVGTLTDDKNFVLTIQDTGTGIPAETLTKVFEPLFSTKAFGTGLGLPTVKQIVEQHGGEVELRSEVGKGTQAIVRLPLRAAQEMAA